MRGDMERSLDEIAKEEKSFEQVVQEMTNKFEEKYLHFEAQMMKLFSKCGCGRFMNYSESAGMLKCKSCGFSLKLQKKPQARVCNTYCWKQVNKKEGGMKSCGFQEIEYRLESRAYEIYLTICPSCYSQ
jgi:tRNA(Ile)-lysidine synthase TilS/MesJ